MGAVETGAMILADGPPGLPSIFAGDMCACSVPELDERPPPIAGYRTVAIDTAAQVHVFVDPSHHAPGELAPPRNDATQPSVVRAGGVNPHVVVASGTYYARLPCGAAFGVRDVNIVSTFGLAVFSMGILYNRGCRLLLDDSPHMRLPSGVCVPVYPRGRLFWVYVEDAPELAPSSRTPDAPSGTADVVAVSAATVGASLRSYPAPPAPASQSDPERPAPRFASGFKLSRSNVRALVGHASDAVVDATCVEYGIVKPPSELAPSIVSQVANATRAPTHTASRTIFAIAEHRRWEFDLVGPFDVRSCNGSRFLLHGIALDGNDQHYTHGVATKGDTGAAFRHWKSTYDAHGVSPLLVVTDASTGEFSLAADSKFDKTMLEIGVAHECRTTEAHVNAVESAHKQLQNAMRASALAARTAPANRWEDNALTCCAALNLRSVGKPSAQRRLLGYLPAVSGWLPFWSIIVVYDSSRAPGRMVPRGVPGRYL